MTDQAPRSPFVRLIGRGVFRGTPVADLREGDVLAWNWGYTSVVLRIERTKAAHTVILHTSPEHGAEVHKQRKALTTLVVLASCGGGCVAADDDRKSCRRCGRRLPVGFRELPIVSIEGRRFYRDERLGEYRAVDNPHERRPL